MKQGLHPGAYKNIRSSKKVMQVLNLSGMLSLYGKRHCPSLAMCAPNNSLCSSYTIVLYESVNNFFGSQITYKISSTNKTNKTYFLRLIKAINLFCCNTRLRLFYNLYPLPFFARIHAVVIHGFNVYARQIIFTCITGVQ